MPGRILQTRVYIRSGKGLVNDGFCTESKLFIIKVRPHLYTHFLDSIHFLQKHSLHTLDCF